MSPAQASARDPRRVVRVRLPLRHDEVGALRRALVAHAIVAVALVVAGHVLRPRLPPAYSTRVRLVGALEAPRASRAPSRPADTSPRPEPAPPREEAKAEPAPAAPADLPGAAPRRADQPEKPKAVTKPRPKAEPATSATTSPTPSEAPAGPPGPPGTDASAGLAASVEGGADGLPDYYLDEIVRKVSSKWLKPAVGLPPQAAIVGFEINRLGRITTPRLEQPSGAAVFDRAALRAVELAAPFGPLPKSRTSGVLKVHFEFTP